jgi:hypothetical protein
VIGPTFKIGDGKALQERVGLNEFLSLSPACRVGAGHDRGGIGVLQRRKDGDRPRSSGKVGQVKCSGRDRQTTFPQNMGVTLGKSRRDLAGNGGVTPQF